MKTVHENVIKRYTSTENRPPDRDYAESKDFLESYFDKKTKGSILRSKSKQVLGRSWVAVRPFDKNPPPF